MLKFPIAASLILCAASLAPAQTPTSTLVGHVQDASGASVPDVSIRVVHTETNEKRTATTTLSGDYSIPGLAPGDYEITFSKTGFSNVRQTGIELHVSQMARVDVKLQVGSVSESVEVTAEAPLLNTETQAQGQVITSNEIAEMPLSDRDYTTLGLLVPGVVPNAQGGQGSTMAVNGARADNTNFMLDGFANREMKSGYPQAHPPLDAVGEFRMETSGYQAEYGRFAGGVMNMVLKSGANDLHGALFEYVRNDIVDARNFFASDNPKLRLNQFGASAGGPVWIPKLYNGRNRTFFMFAWESYHDIEGDARLAAVPSILERQGNFSQSKDATGAAVLVKDPLASGSCTTTSKAACFPGNIIPASRLDPAAVKLMAYFPVPNRAGVNNLAAYANDTDVWNSYSTKVDEQLPWGDNLSVRFLRRLTNSWAPYDGGATGAFGSWKQEPQLLLGLSYTRILRPTLIDEFRAGLTRTGEYQYGSTRGQNIPGLLGFQASTTDPRLDGFPAINITNFALLGDSSSQPVDTVVNNLQWADTLTWNKGRHLMKFGGDVLRTQFFRPYYASNIRGTLYFQGKWTNVPMADAMLGLLSSTSREAGTAPSYLFTTTYGFFAQDSFKATSSLTLDFGLRYEILKPPLEKYGRISNFLPDSGKVILASDATVPNLAAQLAAAGLTGKVGLASDYGLPPSLIDTNYDNFAPRIGFAYRPFHSNRTVVRGGYGIFYGSTDLVSVWNVLTNVYPFLVSQSFSRVSNNPSALVLADPFPDALAHVSAVTSTQGYEVNAPTPYLQSWNMTIEREIFAGVVLQIAYTGSKGTHLGREYNINQPYADPNNPGTTVRPYSAFSTINYFSFGSNSIYNSGTLSLSKRLAKGAFFRLNYVYSKSLDNASQTNDASTGGYAGAQNSRDLKGERGRSDFDIGHNFTMNFTYTVPFHNRLLRGWQFAGTGRMSTGQPFTPMVSNTDISIGEANRPDRIASGKLANPTPDLWFNLSAFVPVPAGSFRPGNSGRNILDGPGYIGLNGSVMKRFDIREKQYLQFRWEVFNVTNHADFYLPSVNVNDPNGGTITRAMAARTMQVALRYQF